MSWAADNPELYDEILKAGVSARLRKEMKDNGFFEGWEDCAEVVVESLSQAKDTSVYDALIKWASKEVSDAEADYFASMADSHD